MTRLADAVRGGRLGQGIDGDFRGTDRRGVEQGNDAVEMRRVAADQHVPLIDYQAEILKRRPDDWDGSLPQFHEAAKEDHYQAPTLIAGDGLHPSNPGKFQDYNEESLKNNGYVLRGYLTLVTYSDVISKVLKPETK